MPFLQESNKRKLFH